MDKKKILIFSHAMEIGGAERALLGLLESIDADRYQVDLFLMRHSGELMKYIPQKINLLPEIPQYAALAVPFKDVLKPGTFSVAAGRLLGKWKAKGFVKRQAISGDNDIGLEYSHKYTRYAMPAINDVHYDLAVSFLTPHYFVSEKVNAKKKIAWIHTDYSNVAVDHNSALKMWSRYDSIAAISKKVSESFGKVFLELKDKQCIIQNMLPEETIRTLASESVPADEMPEDGCIRLLSVGRFCNAKNFESIPKISRRLLGMGCNIKWYIIGYGTDEKLIRDGIHECGMEQRVIILGKKENPYPYITACDWYVQPSRYEGKCVSVTEAQMLHKPVMITRYPTSSSQLTDGIDGLIIPMDIDGCVEAIKNAIENNELRERLIKGTRETDYSNRQEVNKLYQLIEE